ncbi:SpoIIE family protein phosphatase [Nocardioides panzhihuensis]|uniref:Serine phosphatase RsbU (Regulator of sigma subunit)/anti-sigma regulatory factor (Ser/Thr protein kinase) n=1 Tax=Nocardioides panzhihuensis TaxID=860243 RepID=A0A7Z0DPJ3_9ACTN|nr:SpoIIE family protein phosphatase [Nocardioides panzhihuensis]NYI79277.1 serine phosphatase RsbU (regulator of sigma subunit)/anti-sigma regulatory factor (Ser/Thr protein kinase) [Nocardioides panzhihuensis]
MRTRAKTLSRTFEPAPTSVSEARHFARTVLAGWGLDDLLDDAVLLTSELVTNAVTHAGTPMTVAVVREADRLRIDVFDQHPNRVLPVGVNARPGAGEHGRGLLITSALSTAWGVEYRKNHKRVWAAFALVEETLDADAPGAGGPEVQDVRRRRAESAGQDPLGLGGLVLNQLPLTDMLDLVVEQTRERFGADAAYLLLEDEMDDQFVVAATSGSAAPVQGRNVRRGEAGAPGLRASFRPLSIVDLRATPVDLLRGLELRSLVTAPVAFDGRVIGTLAVARSEPSSFTTEDGAELQRIADWAAAGVDRASTRAADGERRGWLAFLGEASVMLAGSLDLETTAAMTGQIVVPRLATWCGIHLNDARDRPRLQFAWHADEQQLDALQDALEKATPEDRETPTEPDFPGEVAILPLEARNRIIGWLTLGRPAGEPLRRERLMVAESIARRAALAIDNARAHTELHEIGQSLQRSLLPAVLPEIPGVDIGVGYEPTGEFNDAGGDFYDIFALGAGRWGFMVGDVCGVGPEAATVAGMSRHTVRALIRAGIPIAPTLERLNAAICDEGQRGRFITMVCGTIEVTAASRFRLRLVCAGHPPPFLVTRARPGVPARRVGRPQALLGVLDAVDYIEDEVTLERGDRFVVVTDGVLERRAEASVESMFEEAGVEAVLAAGIGTGAQAVADRLLRAVADFSTTPPSDDMAVLVLDLGKGLPG